jgi:hypothetical protein
VTKRENKMKTTKKDAKQTKQSAKQAKPARKLLTNAQRSEVARLAAYKAHQHPTFMRLHASAAKNAEVPVKQYLRTLPSFNASLRD